MPKYRVTVYRNLTVDYEVEAENTQGALEMVLDRKDPETDAEIMAQAKTDFEVVDWYVEELKEEREP